MSNLQELKNTAENPLLNKIKEIKNSGVEFRKLENLFNIRNGYTPSKKNESYWTGNTIIPWFRLEDIRENGRVLKDSIQHVTPEAIKGELFEKDSLIISTSATIGEQALIETDFLVNQRFTVLTLKEEFKEKFLPKFLLHYAYILSQYCKDNTNLGTFQSVDMTKFRNFEIPIPPLEVQAEIVRILDTFTELIKELIKEQELRKKQYSYYRDKLLTFEEDSLKKRFRDTCIIKSGEFASPKELSKIQDDLHIYPCYGSNGLRGYINKFNYDGEYPIVGRVGALCGSVNYVSGKFFVTDNALIVQSKGEYIPRFLYYLLISLNLNKYKAGGAQPAIAGKTIYDLSAPLPPIDTQKRIVDILDNFERYTNDLQEGLPAEIEKRKKQYAYYRDELLRFERKKKS